MSINIMPVTIIAGDSGAGKSTFARIFSQKPAVVIDMEARWQNYSEEQIKDIRIINMLEEKYLTNEFMPDATKIIDTLMSIRQLIGANPPKCLIFDGISSVRKLATEYWIKETGRKQAANPGDWSRINQITLMCIQPLILYARAKKITLIMTALMKEIYDDGKPTGVTTIDCLDQIKAAADAIYISIVDAGKFMLHTYKHQLEYNPEPFEWTIKGGKE